MDLTWINVVDTAIKIGFGALISAVSGYLVLKKTQSYEEQKDEKAQYYKLQEEKKSKYVELLVQSQELIQSHLYDNCNPDSESYKKYIRAFNEVQIISNNDIRIAAFNLISNVGAFVLLNKNKQEINIMDDMNKSAKEKVAIFQKYAQEEVTRCYHKT